MLRKLLKTLKPNFCYFKSTALFTKKKTKLNTIDMQQPEDDFNKMQQYQKMMQYHNQREQYQHNQKDIQKQKHSQRIVNNYFKFNQTNMTQKQQYLSTIYKSCKQMIQESNWNSCSIVIDSVINVGKVLQNSQENHILNNKLVNIFIKFDIMELIINEVTQFEKLTPQLQSKLSKCLSTLILIYYQQFEKKFKNNSSTLIKKVYTNKQGLINFLTKIKYLTYHIESSQVYPLSLLLLLYSTAHDMFIKSQNIFQVEKAGIATATFKLITTQENITPTVFTHILFVVTRFTVNNISGYLQNYLYKFIYQKTPKDWYKDRRVSNSFIYSHGKMGITSNSFFYNINKVCEQYQKNRLLDPHLAVRIMLCVFNLQLMTPKILENRYPKLFRDALNQLSKSKAYILNMVRNQVWDIYYWKQVLSNLKPRHFLSKQMRAAIPTVIHHLNIFSDSMQPQFKQVIMKQVKRIQQMPIFQKVFSKITTHHTVFFQTEMQSSNNSFQKDVWKTLKRLGYFVQLQKVIDCVRVDLYFPKRELIIELNGQDHYIKNLDLQKSMDIQNTITTAKIKLLKKSGRKVQSVRIYNESNYFTVTKQIIKILDKYPFVDIQDSEK